MFSQLQLTDVKLKFHKLLGCKALRRTQPGNET